MADESTNEEEPKERKNEYFDDDEDFGLPDLDYDELDEDDEPLEEELDLEVELEGEEEALEELEITEEPVAEEPTSEPIVEENNELPGELDLDETHLEYEVNDEDLADLDLSEEDLEGIDLDDIDLSDISEEDLDLDGEETDFYEEESFDEFENEATANQSFDEGAAVTAEDPGADYQDLAERENKGVEFKYSDPQSRNSFTRIVVIGTVVILTLGFALWFAFLRGGGEEPLAEDPTPVRQEPSNPTPEPETQPAEPEEQTPTPQPEPDPEPTVVSNPGEVTKLSEKTGESYIVIGSFVDEDLADDYAGQLAANGQSPIVIPPFDNHRFYRVAIASYGTYADANAAIDNYKADFGEDIWALRY